jgi:hypothetical protein
MPPPKPRLVRDWIHLFDPNASRTEHAGQWYTNDHCFVRDHAGRWHAFGIIGWRPPDCWANEQQIFHAAGNDLLAGPWTEHPYALVNYHRHAERYLWAPYVIRARGRYHMFYAGGNLHPDAEKFCAYCGIHLATSDDLVTWTRHDRNPLFADCGNARDPFVLEHEGRYLLYYTRTFNEVDHRSCIAVRESPDLVHWSGPRIVHVQPLANHFAGDAESAMVVVHEGGYYLFVCLACTGYHVTRVYRADDPFDFPLSGFNAELDTHAGEVVSLGDGRWAISNTGWDKQGLYAAELVWES